MYEILLESGTEAFINHIKVHKTFFSDITVEAEVVVACAFMAENRRKNADLTMTDPVANQTKIDDLLMANRDFNNTVRTLQKNVFDYFETPPLPELAVKWQLIVE